MYKKSERLRGGNFFFTNEVHELVLQGNYFWSYMDVSKNSGTPKSSILEYPYFWKHTYRIIEEHLLMKFHWISFLPSIQCLGHEQRSDTRNCWTYPPWNPETNRQKHLKHRPKPKRKLHHLKQPQWIQVQVVSFREGFPEIDDKTHEKLK